MVILVALAAFWVLDRPNFEYVFHEDVPEDAWDKLEKCSSAQAPCLEESGLEEDFPHLCRRVHGSLHCAGAREFRSLVLDPAPDFATQTFEIINFGRDATCALKWRRDFETPGHRAVMYVGVILEHPRRHPTFPDKRRVYFPDRDELNDLTGSPVRLHGRCAELIDEAVKEG